jgi:hypothetical protein
MRPPCRAADYGGSNGSIYVQARTKSKKNDE